MVICIYKIILCLLTILLNFIVLEIELNDIRKQYILQINFKLYVYIIDIKKVDKQLTHAMHVKDRHVNDTFLIDKFTKWYQ